jgi:hypothetical protein
MRSEQLTVKEIDVASINKEIFSIGFIIPNNYMKEI